MARRRRHPLLFAALAILFLGAGTAATLLVRKPPRDHVQAPGNGGADGASSPVRPWQEGVVIVPRPPDLVQIVMVLSREDGVPIPGARVKVDMGKGESEFLAGREGIARLTGLPRGEGAVRAEADGWDGPARPLFLSEKEGEPVRILLSPAGVVAGRVLDAGTNAPVGGARVLLHRITDEPERTDGVHSLLRRAPLEVRTGHDGFFSFPSAGRAGEPGRVVALAPGYFAGESRYGPEAGDQAPGSVTVRLAPGASCRGTVRRSDGTPVKGAAVVVIPAGYFRNGVGGNTGLLWRKRLDPNWRETLEGHSGEDGAFSVDGLRQDANYLVGAYLPGHPETSTLVGITVAPGAAESQVDLTLQSPGDLLLRWNRRGGPPEAKVSVEILDEEVGTFAASRWVPAGAGAASFTGLPPGRYGANLETGGRWDVKEIVVVGGATTEATFDLDAPEASDPRGVAGVVVGAGGDLQASVLVSVRSSNSGFTSRTTTGPSGAFHLRLPHGDEPYRVTAERGSLVGQAGPLQAATRDLRIVLGGAGAVEGTVALGSGLHGGEMVEFQVIPDSFLFDGRVTWHQPLTLRAPLQGGRFRLGGVPEGPCLLAGKVGTLHLPPRRVVVVPGTTVTLEEWVPMPSRVVTGRVVDAEGNPREGAFVMREVAPAVFTANLFRSGADGRFRLAGVPPGEEALRIVRAEMIPFVVSVPAGGDAELGDLVMRTGGVVAGWARTSDGALHGGGFVQARPVAAGEEVASGGAVVPQGSFCFRVASGEWELRLFVPGVDAPVATARVMVEEGGTHEVDLRGGRRP